MLLRLLHLHGRAIGLVLSGILDLSLVQDERVLLLIGGARAIDLVKLQLIQLVDWIQFVVIMFFKLWLD